MAKLSMKGNPYDPETGEYYKGFCCMCHQKIFEGDSYYDVNGDYICIEYHNSNKCLEDYMDQYKEEA